MDRFNLLPRAPGIDDGLAARVHDPLWLLARQWQVGEFRHEDAASPAFVDVTTELHVLDQWRPAGVEEWRPYDRRSEPLERVVEEEPRRGPEPRLRLEGGLLWRRLLAGEDLQELLPAFLEDCGFPAAEPGMDALDVAVRRRVPDGARLAPSLDRLAEAATRAKERAELGLPAASAKTVGKLAGEWLDWWRARSPAGKRDADPPAWDEHRLEYAFGVRATTLPQGRLSAAEYQGGRLDWWAFDGRSDAEPAPDDPPPEGPALRAVPAAARYGGMPSARFWEMEDAQFDPGAVDAAPNDLGRLLLVSFAMVYGNDWFVLPLKLPVGTLTRITSFVVTDVFGRESLLEEVGADTDGWNLFGLTDRDRVAAPGEEQPTAPWFLLAPALPDGLESDPLESVLLLRDEMANVAWAVEATVPDDAGRRLDRFAQWAARDVPPDPPAETPRYRVATEVPDHWFPLAPEPLDGGEAVRRRLVPLVRSRAGKRTAVLPEGGLLASARAENGDGVWLHEEEVPRAGAAVVRTHQHARWHDGSVHGWTGRRKGTGGGEGSSGLRYDVVEEGGT